MRREPDPSENNSTGSAQAIGLVFATTMQQTTVPLVLVLVLVLETTFRVVWIVDPVPPAIASQLQRFGRTGSSNCRPSLLDGSAARLTPIESSLAFQSQRDGL